MKRIMVIGGCGSGKSSLSKKLSDKLRIPLFHLDQFYWQPNWVEMEKTRWEETVSTLAEKPKWIIDGNYSGTMDTRIKRADTIIYLDFPTMTCLWRITKRIYHNYGQVRSDMPEGCKERFDLDFYHYVLIFNITRRKGILKKIEALKKEKEIFILKNDKETEQFLNTLAPRTSNFTE